MISSVFEAFGIGLECSVLERLRPKSWNLDLDPPFVGSTQAGDEVKCTYSDLV